MRRGDDTPERRNRDYVTAFHDSDAGRRVLDDLKATFCLRPSYVPGDSDAMEIAFREGQKSVVRHIETRVNRGINREQADAEI